MTNTPECASKSDEDLVLLALADQNYFICIMERYSDKLYRYIQRISSLSREDIEDVLQEVFIKVYKNLNEFNRDLKFSSWIYRIAHNHLISAVRKIKVRPEGNLIEVEEAVYNNFKSELNVEKEINNKITREKLLMALAKLDIKFREVLILYYFEEKSYLEISDILKKPAGTVATLLLRARKKLKEIFLKEQINLI